MFSSSKRISNWIDTNEGGAINYDDDDDYNDNNSNDDDDNNDD